jgi:hypothetical protein
VADTSLDSDLDDLLWSTVNIFHRAVDRIEQARRQRAGAKALQREQDGSEVKSVQLERLIDIGMNLIERRDGMETFREAAAEHYLAPPAHPGRNAPDRGSTIATSPRR